MMNLEKLGLSSEDLLQRSQLATIMGGNDQEEDEIDGAPCTITRCSSTQRCCPGESCSDASEHGWCQ
ncbi:hypothetical protein MM239_14720 [Belliella sp. DSM 111904]|uniref:Uncharacterized protein n=1 Tax=Belliella filtrata TaxID=2923435 RepID=A0ABS9V2T0_9BACT|nr:hypothetical protein [Belliella filtrata]MCH7410659.1 hypothetical protein [Belliella filtrata]